MSALLMWGLGGSQGVAMSENEAQATTEPIRDDPQLAEAPNAPDFNEIETDTSGELMGLSHRLVGSDTVNIEKYQPWWATYSDYNHNALIDDQVASSGTAAQRELAGQQGHGTMQYALGIDPILREGGSMGNDYFVSHPTDIQEGAGNYMNPQNNDQWANAVAQATANRNSRQSFDSTLYADFLKG